MASDYKIFILKNGDVSQELRSQLSGNEPPHSYISEIMTLQSLGELHVVGCASAPDRYDYKGVHCRTLRRKGGILTQARFYFQVWRYLGEINPDLVVVLHPWELLVAPYLWCRFNKRSFLPCLPKPPESEYVGSVRKWFSRLVIKPLLRRSQVVLARCTLIKDLLIGWGIEEAKIIVYLPPYTNEFLECKRLLPSSSAQFNIVFIGRLVRLKGVYDLLEIFARVLGKAPDVKLFVIGTGPELEPMKKWAEAENITQSITFVGEIPPKDVYGYLAPADIALLPSYQEGIGKTALEALLSGLPVLATANTGFTEFIRHGENGYLFPAGDIKQFENALIELYYDRERLAGLKANAVKSGHKIMTDSKTFADCVSNIATSQRDTFTERRPR